MYEGWWKKIETSAITTCGMQEEKKSWNLWNLKSDVKFFFPPCCLSLAAATKATSKPSNNITKSRIDREKKWNEAIICARMPPAWSQLHVVVFRHKIVLNLNVVVGIFALSTGWLAGWLVVRCRNQFRRLWFVYLFVGEHAASHRVQRSGCMRMHTTDSDLRANEFQHLPF